MLHDLRASLSGAPGILRRGLPLLAIALLADAAFIFVFLIVLQTYLPESLHASPAIAGYALAAFGIAKLCSQVASGVVADRIGTRRAMIAGMALLAGASALLWPLAHVAPYLIVATSLLEGVGSSLLWPALYAAGTSRFDDGEKSRFTAMLTLATMGALFAALGGGTLLNMYVSFDVAMAVPVSFTALALFIALLTPVSAREAQEREAMETPSLRELPAILHSRQRLAFSAIVVFESVALGAIAAIFRAYGRDIAGVSLTREGVLLAPAAVLGGLAVLGGGALADRAGARRVMAPGFLAAGIAVLLLSVVTQPGLIVVLAAIGGVGFGFAVPTIASTMMKLSGGAGTRGGTIGWFMSMDGLGHSLGPALAAALLAAFDARAAMLLAGTAFLGVGVIAAWEAPGEQQESEAGQRASAGRREGIGTRETQPWGAKSL